MLDDHLSQTMTNLISPWLGDQFRLPWESGGGGGYRRYSICKCWGGFYENPKTLVLRFLFLKIWKETTFESLYLNLSFNFTISKRNVPSTEQIHVLIWMFLKFYYKALRKFWKLLLEWSVGTGEAFPCPTQTPLCCFLGFCLF